MNDDGHAFPTSDFSHDGMSLRHWLAGQWDPPKDVVAAFIGNVAPSSTVTGIPPLVDHYMEAIVTLKRLYADRMLKELEVE